MQALIGPKSQEVRIIAEGGRKKGCVCAVPAPTLLSATLVFPLQSSHNDTEYCTTFMRYICVGSIKPTIRPSLIEGSYLIFWAESTTQDYITAKNNVQSVSHLFCTQVTKPQIIQKNKLSPDTNPHKTKNTSKGSRNHGDELSGHNVRNNGSEKGVLNVG